jgi:hypothetical protein
MPDAPTCSRPGCTNTASVELAQPEKVSNDKPRFLCAEHALQGPLHTEYRFIGAA